MPFQPITSEKLSAAVVRQVEQLILRGILRPGERLPAERELAERLAVSRPSLRDAIAQLQASGLLTAKPGAGVYVADVLGSAFSPALTELFARHDEAVFDYLSFRRDMEGIAAARAALSPSVGFLSVLMGIGGGSFGVPLMSLFNVPIHRAVATAAGFGVLIAVPSVIGFLLVDAAPNSPPLTVGAVNLPTFAIVIAMTLITAPLGVRLAHAMDPKPLKRVFAVFLILVALNMLRKSLGL